ncbi:hypothetical protein JCM11491_006186 [Sporobolomyces phaffii]
MTDPSLRLSIRLAFDASICTVITSYTLYTLDSNFPGDSRPASSLSDLSLSFRPLPDNHGRRHATTAALHVPRYAQRARPTSPDVLSALFHPVLESLSRPRSTSSSSVAAESDPAPSVESQGFLLYVASAVAYGVYLVWSLAPADFLARAGVAWHPAKEWAVLVPSWITVSVVYVYVAYALVNLSHHPSPSPSDSDSGAFVPPPLAPRPLVDAARPLGGGGPSSVIVVSRLYLDSVVLAPEAIPPLYDLPLTVVNRVLYDD